MRFVALIGAVVVCVLAIMAAVALGGIAWIVIAVLSGALAAVGIHDVIQRRQSILRNYPISDTCASSSSPFGPSPAVLHRAQLRRTPLRP